MVEKNLPSLIRALAESGEAARRDGAGTIFRAGSELVAPLIRKWVSDPELAAHVVMSSGVPEITVGVAVQPANFERIRGANGSPPLADVPPDQDAREFEIEFEGGVRLDILTSGEAGGTGAIARYLQKFGEGIQQVEINVDNVDAAVEILRTRFGVQTIYPAARNGANGTRVNFFLASIPAGGKVLVELVQASEAR